MSDAEARGLGLSDERAHGGWAYLMLMSHGRVARSRDARDFITRGERPPDEQMGRLVAMRAEALGLAGAPAGEAGDGGSI